MNGLKYMLQVEKLDTLIQSKEREIKRLSEVATHITSAFKEVTVSGGVKSNKIEESVIKICDLKDELRADIENYVETKKNILAKIERLEANQYKVLFKRYFDYKDYESIANEMHYSRMQIYRIHQTALKSLELII